MRVGFTHGHNFSSSVLNSLRNNTKNCDFNLTVRLMLAIQATVHLCRYACAGIDLGSFLSLRRRSAQYGKSIFYRGCAGSVSCFLVFLSKGCFVARIVLPCKSD